MSILSASQAAMARLVGRRPAAVVSSSNEMEVEITALALEAAIDIAKAHDWQALTKLCTLTGVEGQTSFPLPADYDRMTLAGAVSSSSWPDWRFQGAQSLDDWLDITTRDATLSPGWWIILNNEFQIFPAVAVGETARFYYISNAIFRALNGAAQTDIVRDDDSFILNERLLTLALIWRWKQMKSMDYQEDMRLYEDAFSQEMARDKGSRVIRDNGMGHFPGAVKAWPWSLGGV